MIPILHFNNQNCAYGSGANGHYLVFADGLMLCWNQIECAFDTTATLMAEWTYPRAFAEPPLVMGTRTADIDINGFANNGSGPWVADVHSETAARLFIGRFSGTADFGAGNTWDTDVLAWGFADETVRNSSADLVHWNDGNVLRGSNANGSYVRYPNGVQICWHAHTLTMLSNASLQNTWTFPRAFTSVPFVFSMKGEDRSITPPANAVTGPRQGFKSLTQTSLLLSRQSGQANFGANDTWLVHSLAIGIATS